MIVCHFQSLRFAEPCEKLLIGRGADPFSVLVCENKIRMNPLTEVIDIVQEYATATDPMKATLSTLSRQLGMNFNKMDPAEIQFFTGIVEKYSNVYKSMLPKKGRGKR